MMTFALNRMEHDGVATRGALLDPAGARLCYTLEDRFRAVKVKGSTRIPAGIYGLELKPKGTSRFDATAARIVTGQGLAYHGMIRLRDVPDFSEILFHWGNYHTDTEGCLLGGLTRMMSGGVLAVGGSRDAFAHVYPVLAAAILAGPARLIIRNLDGTPEDK